jgi:CRP/FNR family transcriptional regulator
MIRVMREEKSRDTEEALRITPPFNALPPADRKRLAPFAFLRRYAREDLIFSEGDPSDRFHTVVSGRVKIVKLAPHGKELILEIFGAGDPFGAVAAYEGRPFPASAIALQPTEVLSIARRDFFALIADHPEIARGLLLGLTRRLVELTQKLAQMTSGGVEYRIASLFLRLADRIGEKRDGAILIPLALSRQDIADMVGTTIETAIRVMSRWGKEGVIRTERTSFVIENREALEEIAEEG